MVDSQFFHLCPLNPPNILTIFCVRLSDLHQKVFIDFVGLCVIKYVIIWSKKCGTLNFNLLVIDVCLCRQQNYCYVLTTSYLSYTIEAFVFLILCVILPYIVYFYNMRHFTNSNEEENRCEIFLDMSYSKLSWLFSSFTDEVGNVYADLLFYSSHLEMSLRQILILVTMKLLLCYWRSNKS